jgi:negative regulator of sigma E activity
MDDQSPAERERVWRRPVSGAERAAWRGQPELELEARLTDALAELPDASVPSNFTARVMASIDLEEARLARSRGGRWNWHLLLPRMAVATAIVLFTGLGFQQYQVSHRRTEMVRTVSAVASATVPVPSADVLENLEVIQRMSQTSHADTELLTDLQ